MGFDIPLNPPSKGEFYMYCVVVDIGEEKPDVVAKIFQARNFDEIQKNVMFVNQRIQQKGFKVVNDYFTSIHPDILKVSEEFNEQEN